jgi:hypothetical protein
MSRLLQSILERLLVVIFVGIFSDQDIANWYTDPESELHVI